MGSLDGYQCRAEIESEIPVALERLKEAVIAKMVMRKIEKEKKIAEAEELIIVADFFIIPSDSGV